ncbi:AgmX/PglI C-terminal domain-containing protein [Pendulispora albinea]|uniref:AgmX/PglI C-terminal domain-containing protein n=1 Tax=Pendulispora albinea TaxID=2741071 RepID=A0ABZ2LZZ0_9BACT
MTAQMRALAPEAGPKVLRIGLVQGGRIVHERVVKQRVSVTVGADDAAMFPILAEDMPSSGALFLLFERRGDDYYVNFTPEMTGRIALRGGIVALEALRREAPSVRLTEDARGRIVVGGSTFLFQFVPPPPAQPRPQLPLSATKGGVATEIDWQLTIVAAFSFLLHFGFIGAMYSDWMDPAVDEQIAVNGLIDSLKAVALPLPVETPPDSPRERSPLEMPPESKAESPSKTSKSPKDGDGSMSDRGAAALAREADAIQMQLLASLGGPSAVHGALGRGDVPLPDLSGVAGQASGVDTAGGLRVGSAGGGVIQPGRAGGGLAGIGRTGSSGIGERAGDAREVQGPKGAAQIGAPQTSVPVANAESVVAALRPKFRQCYQRYGLSVDPSMAGAVTIVTKVGPNGEVSAADPSGVSGLSNEVVSCIQRAVRNASFAAPGGTGGVIQIPIKFVQQR